MTVKEEKLEVARLSHAEIACYEMYDQIDEVFCSLVVLKAFLNSDDYNKFHAVSMIDGLVRQLINNQCDMMNSAKLEY
jgi:hypothetical protein